MVSPIVGTGRNLTTDNWYISVPLAEGLLKMKVTLVGTMRKNKPDIPPEMTPNKNRKSLSSQFGFQKKNDDGFLCAQTKKGSYLAVHEEFGCEH